MAICSRARALTYQARTTSPSPGWVKLIMRVEQREANNARRSEPVNLYSWLWLKRNKKITAWLDFWLWHVKTRKGWRPHVRWDQIIWSPQTKAKNFKRISSTRSWKKAVKKLVYDFISEEWRSEGNSRVKKKPLRRTPHVFRGLVWGGVPYAGWHSATRGIKNINKSAARVHLVTGRQNKSGVSLLLAGRVKKNRKKIACKVN